jgi:hypothetical protein
MMANQRRMSPWFSWKKYTTNISARELKERPWCKRSKLTALALVVQAVVMALLVYGTITLSKMARQLEDMGDTDYVVTAVCFPDGRVKYNFDPPQ